jgi:hypothetical protein
LPSTSHALPQAVGLVSACRRFAWWEPIGRHLAKADHRLGQVIRSSSAAQAR